MANQSRFYFFEKKLINVLYVQDLPHWKIWTLLSTKRKQDNLSSWAFVLLNFSYLLLSDPIPYCTTYRCTHRMKGVVGWKFLRRCCCLHNCIEAFSLNFLQIFWRLSFFFLASGMGVLHCSFYFSCVLLLLSKTSQTNFFGFFFLFHQ